MSLKRGELNPLAVYNLRKLNFIPDHFTKVSISKIANISLLDHWINFNLNSRYAIVKNYTLDEKKNIVEIIEIGLEDQKEISMLTLGCPHLYNK